MAQYNQGTNWALLLTTIGWGALCIFVWSKVVGWILSRSKKNK
jgi:hypothetical protein